MERKKSDVLVADEDKPVLQCQGDTVLYTRGDRAAAHWFPPEVTDNSAAPTPANCSLAWGAQLPLGKTNIR